MKLLRRLLLVKWHYIEHELIEFSPVTFLTGKNAAGKSTILDALQLVLLGDTTGHFFNKAANDNSKRTLKGYLRGEIGEQEGVGVINLRDGQFTSYIVLEFTDEHGKKPFCFGIVFDSIPDGKQDGRFFSLMEELPDFHFIHDGIPLDIKALSAWGQKRNHGFEMFVTNKRYQEVFRSRMGTLKEKYFQLFRKAVPFSPIMDISGFISEFVCDVSVHLDIDDMRENIRHYRRMEEELHVVEARVQALSEMDATYQGMEAATANVKLYDYLFDRANLTAQNQRIDELHAQLARAEQDALQLDEKLRVTTDQRKTVQDLRDELLTERANSTEYQRQQWLEKDKSLLDAEFAQIRRDGERQDKFLVDHGERWRAVARKLVETDEWMPEEPFTASATIQSKDPARPEAQLLRLAPLCHDASQRVKDALSNWPRPAEWKAYQLLSPDIPSAADPEILREAAERLRNASNLLRDSQHLLRNTTEEWTQESEDLQHAIAQLRRGIKQYDAKVLGLKNVLETGLSEGGRTVEVHIFADLLDIQNREWQKAIEGYLHTQRFYLIVPPERFDEALRLYDAAKHDHKLFDVGLVDIAKVMAEEPVRLPGSLAEEIKTDNSYAQAYADYLLGRVMKCDSVDELRKHRTGITRNGMLYQNFVARQINPVRWDTLYIGKHAITQQLEKTTNRFTTVQKFLDSFRPRLVILAELAAVASPSQSEWEAAVDFLKSVETLPELHRKYQAVINELGRLDLTRIQQIDDEIRACDLKLQEKDKQIQELNTEQGKLTKAQEQLLQVAIPVAEDAVRDQQLIISSRYDPLYAADMNPHYEQELKRLGSPENILISFRRQQTTEKKHVEEAQIQLLRQREVYNREFGAGFDIQRPDNEVYAEELKTLQKTRLTEYADQIREARERAQIQFQEDFINRLRSNIDTVDQQIKELNHALREVSFGGRERYQFKVATKPQYEPFYRMIMDDLLLEGRSLFSQAFLDKHGAVIEELFRHIVDVDERDPAVQTELERNLQKFTDYRTYLDFDLIVRDEEGRESRLSKVIAKKSGGETQTPFYIAVLASFVQTYRVNQPGFNNTLRLIMFDEAYSKMDHQRIRDSIQLVRDLKLQVILSAPTEKIADIVPLVDRTLVVQRIKSQTRVELFEPETKEMR